ncbi:hypothetical protein P5673_033595 [Acropora cervicornis]|uniref:Uncharacterized protein n=1 Tax=Acropora cervicornis TaxID=6130 RepID=A0AAD9PPS5_ACRCE|nr:hypothetical protein P5673_033595 [Acropora cervicornis]
MKQTTSAFSAVYSSWSMDVMDLYTEKISCSLISELSASDFLQVEELYISFLGSLLYPKVEKTAEVALRELCLPPKFLFASVLRCITDKFFSCGRFPQNEGIVYQWFDHPSSGGTRNPVQAINVEKEVVIPCNGNNLFNAVKLSELNLLDDMFEIFYHGTSHDSAEDIIAHGINLTKGGKGMDFSSGDGFYVSKDLCLARERAARRFGDNNSAVLVFQVRKVELRGDSNDNGLDLTGIDRKGKWKELVKNFLSEKPSKKFLKTIKGYDFIEGPMVAKGRNDFLSFPKPKNDSYQLCVRTARCVSLFDRSLCAALYFA